MVDMVLFTNTGHTRTGEFGFLIFLSSGNWTKQWIRKYVRVVRVGRRSSMYMTFRTETYTDQQCIWQQLVSETEIEVNWADDETSFRHNSLEQIWSVSDSGSALNVEV